MLASRSVPLEARVSPRDRLKMNTTVAVVLPEWMVWMLSVIIILQGVHVIASIYVEWLKSRIEKGRANNQSDRLAEDKGE